MPIYRVYRMKDTPRQQFRWAPHASGATQAKPRDFELGPEWEAPSPYALWSALQGSADALQVGDVLESEGGQLHIFKYTGFEELSWQVPHPGPICVEVRS